MMVYFLVQSEELCRIVSLHYSLQNGHPPTLCCIKLGKSLLRISKAILGDALNFAVVIQSVTAKTQTGHDCSYQSVLLLSINLHCLWFSSNQCRRTHDRRNFFNQVSVYKNLYKNQMYHPLHTEVHEAITATVTFYVLFSFRYHDMPDVLDFVILRQLYERAMAKNWREGRLVFFFINQCDCMYIVLSVVADCW